MLITSDTKMSPYVMPGLRYRYQHLHQPDLDFVFNQICKYYEVAPTDAKKKCRKRMFVLCRQVFMFLISTGTKVTLSEIGRFFPWSHDHTTVIHGRETIRDLMWSDPEIKAQVDYLKIHCGL